MQMLRMHTRCVECVTYRTHCVNTSAPMHAVHGSSSSSSRSNRSKNGVLEPHARPEVAVVRAHPWGVAFRLFALMFLRGNGKTEEMPCFRPTQYSRRLHCLTYFLLRDFLLLFAGVRWRGSGQTGQSAWPGAGAPPGHCERSEFHPLFWRMCGSMGSHHIRLGRKWPHEFPGPVKTRLGGAIWKIPQSMFAIVNGTDATWPLTSPKWSYDTFKWPYKVILVIIALLLGLTL